MVSKGWTVYGRLRAFLWTGGLICFALFIIHNFFSLISHLWCSITSSTLSRTRSRNLTRDSRIMEKTKHKTVRLENILRSRVIYLSQFLRSLLEVSDWLFYLTFAWLISVIFRISFYLFFVNSKRILVLNGGGNLRKKRCLSIDLIHSVSIRVICRHFSSFKLEMAEKYSFPIMDKAESVFDWSPSPL